MSIKRLVLCIFVFFVFGLLGYGATYVGFGTGAISAVFSKIFEEKITQQDLQNKYEIDKIKILIVPGHDNNSFGASFKNIKESDLNIEMAYEIFDILIKDNKFETFIIRERDGAYSRWFLDYLDRKWSAISTFRDYSKRLMSFLNDKGFVVAENKVQHNPAADNVSLNLYGINKWANDNNVDLVIHVHFNDYPSRARGQSGEYAGFVIYIPERHLPNHKISSGLASAIKQRLENYFPKSNFPGERETIVEDHELIAIGSNASRKGASLLIEYGYIYETQFVYSSARAIIFESLAEQTYLGIQDYFELDALKK
ncbi:N-acetylmuramoyl-L-alanine amidase [Patescibacteria group bacterium]